MPDFGLQVCDFTFLIECQQEETAALIRTAFGGLIAAPDFSSDISRRYAIEGCAVTGGYRVVDSGGSAAWFANASSLLYYLDKHITVTLQHLRPDAFFLHAAAVALDGHAAVLAAPSGAGKSTLTLALLDRGFEYLSDELAPINVATLDVRPYARALCLKSLPPPPYGLPAGTLDMGDRRYVPIDGLRARILAHPQPVAAFFFVARRQGDGPPCRRMSPASAAANLMANALNAAAHPAMGLDAAISLSRAVPCFSLDSTDLDAACSAVELILTDRGASSETCDADNPHH